MMHLITQDTIRDIRDINVCIANKVGDELTKMVQGLERAFGSSDAQIPKEEMLKNLIAFHELSIRMKATEDIAEKIEILTEIQSFLKNFRLKYKNFISESTFREIESDEIYGEALKEITTGKLFMHAAATEKDEVKQFQMFYTGLVRTSGAVENYIQLLPEGLHCVIAKLAEDVLANFCMNCEANGSSNSGTINGYIIATRNAAKGILWEIRNYQEKTSKKQAHIKEISLTTSQVKVIQQIAQQTKRPEAAILHEAVEQSVQHFQQNDRNLPLKQARGMWKERNDLPDISSLRNEFNRFN